MSAFLGLCNSIYAATIKQPAVEILPNQVRKRG
jgi:hypothetical protein